MCFCHCLHYGGYLDILISPMTQLIFGLCHNNQLCPRMMSLLSILSTIMCIHSEWSPYLTRSLHSDVIIPCLFCVLSAFNTGPLIYLRAGCTSHPKFCTTSGCMQDIVAPLSNSADMRGVYCHLWLVTKMDTIVVATCFHHHKHTTMVFIRQSQIWPKS